MKLSRRSTSKSQNIRSRQGIALVLVLAFLSILLFLSVAFTTLMRTERAASRNYANIVQAREFLHTGLARALNDLDEEMKGRFYPHTNAIYSQRESSDPFSDAMTNLLDQSNLQRGFFPGSASEWDAIRDAVVEKDASEAQSILDPDGDTIIGRISYVAVDGGGLLDINVVGTSNVSRATGKSPEEIQLSEGLLTEIDLTKVDASENITNFFNYYHHFETLDEFNELGTSPIAPLNPMLKNLPDSFPDSFSTYSRFPTGRFDRATHMPETEWYIGGDVAALTASNGFMQAITDIGKVGKEIALTEEDRNMTFANLLDYVDPDDIPANRGIGTFALRSFCTEAIPMLNEIAITNTVEVKPNADETETEYISTLDVGVELWYPFVGYTNKADYELEYEVSFVSAGGGPVPVLQPTIAAPPLTESESGPWNDEAVNRFRTPKHFQAIGTLVLPGTEKPIFPDSVTHTLKVVNKDGDSVDELVFTEKWGDSYVTDLAPGVHQEAHGKECNDPRINWDWDMHWVTVPGSDPHTFGAVNSTNAAKFADAGNDGITDMYVANRPLLNVGELGFLLYGTKPWQTIPLYGDRVLEFPIMDYFTTSTITNQRGLVNINTQQEEVLGSVFLNSGVETAPGIQRFEGLVIDLDASSTLASILTNQTDVIGSGTGVTNLSAVFGNLGDAEFKTLENELVKQAALDTTDLPLSEMERESIVRNSLDLLSTRQQLFTIFLQAESVTDRNKDNEIDLDEVLARQKAIAVVWRDPFRTGPGVGYPPEVVYFGLVGE